MTQGEYYLHKEGELSKTFHQLQELYNNISKEQLYKPADGTNALIVTASMMTHLDGDG